MRARHEGSAQRGRGRELIDRALVALHVRRRLAITPVATTTTEAPSRTPRVATRVLPADHPRAFIEEFMWKNLHPTAAKIPDAIQALNERHGLALVVTVPDGQDDPEIVRFTTNAPLSKYGTQREMRRFELRYWPDPSGADVSYYSLFTNPAHGDAGADLVWSGNLTAEEDKIALAMAQACTRKNLEYKSQ